LRQASKKKKIRPYLKNKSNQAWWFMPVILATWEIRRITVQDKPRQKVSKTPSLSIKKAVCGGTCLSSLLLRKCK
jgi:hypothetical protein